MKRKDKRSNLEKEIDKVLEVMARTDKLSEEYAKLVEYLEKLYVAGAKAREPKKQISPDTLLLIGANLLGIILILGYEQVSVVTSKALGFVVRGRV